METNKELMRAEFEEWAMKDGYKIHMKGNQKAYPSAATQSAWEIWQAALSQRSEAVPEGYVLAPHYRGYAHLGTGNYILNHSCAGDPAEFVASIATEAEKDGRVVGDLQTNSPDALVQPDAMAVRIRFENVAGLDALEQQLRLLRVEHFPESLTPAAQPTPAQGDAVPVESNSNGLEREADELARADQSPVKITDDELAAFHRFCDCCEDFDAGGHDVPKDMMRQLTLIGLVRAAGPNRHETTNFGDWIRDASNTGTPPANATRQSSADAVDAALELAVSAIYFDDGSKYEGALWNIVRALSPSILELLHADPRAAFYAVKSAIAAQNGKGEKA